MDSSPESQAKIHPMMFKMNRKARRRALGQLGAPLGVCTMKTDTMVGPRSGACAKHEDK